MKKILLIAYSLIYGTIHAQTWENLSNTGIQKISIKTDWDFKTYFHRDSSLISVPNKLQSEFSQLFIDNQGAFDSICQTCAGLRLGILSDSLKTYFEKSKVKYIIYFTERTIREEGDTTLWGMTSFWGQVQPCWPVIHIKKIIIQNVVRLLFLFIDRGMCEI